MDNPEKRRKGIEESAEQKEKPISVCRLVVIFEDKVLVVQRNLLTHFYASMWSLPGGKNEGPETLEETAKRELREETGLDLGVNGVIDTFIYEETGTEVIFFRTESNSMEIHLNEENVNHFWVSRDNWRNFEYTPETEFILEKYFSAHMATNNNEFHD